MNKKKLKYIIVALCIISFSSLAIFIIIDIINTNFKDNNDFTRNGTSEAHKAPFFETTTLDGQHYNFYDNLDKPTVINFFATWCPICVKEMPYFQEMEDKYPEVDFLMIVDGGDSPEKIQEVLDYINEFNLEFDNILLDPKIKIAKAFEIPGYPSTIFVDEDATIIDGVIGKISKSYLEDVILNMNIY